jgi:hypothetical protein
MDYFWGVVAMPSVRDICDYPELIGNQELGDANAHVSNGQNSNSRL